MSNFAPKVSGIIESFFKAKKEELDYLGVAPCERDSDVEENRKDPEPEGCSLISRGRGSTIRELCEVMAPDQDLGVEGTSSLDPLDW